MKILSCVMDEERMGWANAFKDHDHDFQFLSKPVFDVFHDEEPDIIIINNATLTKDVSQCIQQSKTKAYNIDTHKPHPSGDPYTFKVGEFNEQYESDIGIFGTFTENVPVADICEIINEKPRVTAKIFGFGPWPFPQFIGALSPSELCDAVASVTSPYFFGSKAESTLYNLILAAGPDKNVSLDTNTRTRYNFVMEENTCVHRMNEVLEKAE